jgi:hypothetical protein
VCYARGFELGQAYNRVHVGREHDRLLLLTRLRPQESLDRCIDADVVDEVETEQAARMDPMHRLG